MPVAGGVAARPLFRCREFVERQMFTLAKSWTGGRTGGAWRWQPSFTAAPTPQWRVEYDDAGNVVLNCVATGGEVQLLLGNRSREEYVLDREAARREARRVEHNRSVGRKKRHILDPFDESEVRRAAKADRPAAIRALRVACARCAAATTFEHFDAFLTEVCGAQRRNRQ